MAYPAPKVKAPPMPNKNNGTNPPPKSKSPGSVGSNNVYIELKFCKGFDWNNIEIIELNSFEEFFLFYQEHSEKGLIYEVKLI